MEFEEMNNFLSNHKAGEQDVRLRIRKRTLESRERQVLGTLSAAYGFDLFFLGMGLLGVVPELRSMQFSKFVCFAGGFGIAMLVLGFAIYRMWRNPPPSTALLALPGLAFAVLGLPSLNLLFFVNVIALIALYTLSGIWKELQALAVQSVQPA